MTEKPTLLIVDDEKPTRDGLRAALEDRYDVYVAENTKAATELLERDNFDVLLTDFRLPNEDGLKLIARAKSLSRPPVCILMTAYGSEELAVEAMKRGADDYIAKGRLQISNTYLLKASQYPTYCSDSAKLWSGAWRGTAHRFTAHQPDAIKSGWARKGNRSHR